MPTYIKTGFYEVTDNPRGKQYLNLDRLITEIAGSGGIPDAPADNEIYGRQNNAWVVVPSGGSQNLQQVLDQGNVSTTGFRIDDGSITISDSGFTPSNFSTRMNLNFQHAGGTALLAMDNIQITGGGSSDFIIGRRTQLEKTGSSSFQQIRAFEAQIDWVDGSSGTGQFASAGYFTLDMNNSGSVSVGAQVINTDVDINGTDSSTVFDLVAVASRMDIDNPNKVLPRIITGQSSALRLENGADCTNLFGYYVDWDFFDGSTASGEVAAFRVNDGNDLPSQMFIIEALANRASYHRGAFRMDQTSAEIDAANQDVVINRRYLQETYTVATLPASPYTNQRTMVTDSTVAASGNFAAVVAGGGANTVPVFYDGSDWRIG